jgi:predicted phosphoadenosine phosphosulfate sulfurtransferase
MKIYKNATVFEESLKRIRWIYEEFDNVIIGNSGGKDSTVITELAIVVARDMGRLPVKVLFLDQEAEWQATIDQIRYTMYREEVDPYWYQMPMKLFNATSSTEHWLYCWNPDEEERWVHPKDPISIKENRYGTDRFQKLFANILRVEYPDTPTAYLAGIRTEEAPGRFMAVTSSVTYKGVTWASKLDRRRHHYTFFPIYDWSYTDVWKAIHDNGWRYNRIYDHQYQHGVHVKDMRVSNVHHETAVHSLFHMQELEPYTYDRLTQRIAGVDMAAKMGVEDYFAKRLPFMFTSWQEYRDYLLEKLIDNEDWKARMRRRFASMDKVFLADVGDKLYRIQIQSILTNDWECIKLGNFTKSPEADIIRKRNRGEKVY